MKHLNLRLLFFITPIIVSASNNNDKAAAQAATNNYPLLKGEGRSLQQQSTVETTSLPSRPKSFSNKNNSTSSLLEPYKEDPFISNVNDFINTTHTISQQITDAPTSSPAPSVSTVNIPQPSGINNINSNTNNNNNTRTPTSTSYKDDTDFQEFIGFIGWYAFLIICCILPTICTYYRRRRRHAYLLNENISSIRLRLEEMERYNNANNNGGGDTGGILLRLEEGQHRQDWDVLESLFSSSTNATTNTNRGASIATLGMMDGNTNEERRRQIMSDILMGRMSVASVMEREQRRKRERGRRLVSLLKECSLCVKEGHLIPKEGVSGSAGSGGGGDDEWVGGGEDGDIELGNGVTVQNNVNDEGVDKNEGEECNDHEEMKSNPDTTVNKGSESIAKSDIDVESPSPMKDGDEEESDQQSTPTPGETSDKAATTTSANDAPESSSAATPTTTALQQTVQITDTTTNTQSSLLPSSTADNSSTMSNNNILSLYQTDDLYDDDDDDNKYSALCLPCSPTHNSATTSSSTTLPMTRSAPTPQSTLDNEPSTRLVPPTCAICLLSYSPGCYVTWSSNPECIHVFHRDCILVWLLKKEEPLCPCCRREFVSTSALNAAVSRVDDDADNINSRIEQYRRTIMLLDRHSAMETARQQSAANVRRSERFARMSMQEEQTPNWDSVGLGRLRHF